MQSRAAGAAGRKASKRRGFHLLSSLCCTAFFFFFFCADLFMFFVLLFFYFLFFADFSLFFFPLFSFFFLIHFFVFLCVLGGVHRGRSFLAFRGRPRFLASQPRLSSPRTWSVPWTTTTPTHQRRTTISARPGNSSLTLKKTTSWGTVPRISRVFFCFFTFGWFCDVALAIIWWSVLFCSVAYYSDGFSTKCLLSFFGFFVFLALCVVVCFHVLVSCFSCGSVVVTRPQRGGIFSCPVRVCSSCRLRPNAVFSIILACNIWCTI